MPGTDHAECKPSTDHAASGQSIGRPAPRRGPQDGVEDPGAELEELIIDARAALLMRTPDVGGTVGLDAFSAVVANPIGARGTTELAA